MDNYYACIEPQLWTNLYSCYPIQQQHADTEPGIHSNRFVYINQNFCQPSGNVYINPNFKNTVHFNPNFKRTIHVNPNVIKLRHCNINTKSQFITAPNTEPRSSLVLKDTPFISTKTTLVRKIMDHRKIRDVILPKVEGIQSVYTKYKIVRTSKNQRKINITTKNSKYKIDRTINNKKVIKRRIVMSKYYLLNKSILSSSSAMKKKNLTSRFICKDGILYKKTPNILKKANLHLSSTTEPLINKSRLLKIDGKIYKTYKNQKKLQLIVKRNSPHSLKKDQKYFMKKMLLLSQIKNHHCQVFSGKMRKSNVQCSFYKKSGKCQGKESGTCIKIHNPDHISLCSKFLQGTCENNTCSLSHKVSDEKMPICKYYLEGTCLKDDCPYVHVRINPKADICKDFLQGFCRKAKECNKRHQFLCPDFERRRSCPRPRCRYPHESSVRCFRSSGKAAKKSMRNSKVEIVNDCTNNIVQNGRYYVDVNVDKKKIGMCLKNDDGNELFEDCDSGSSSKRKNVGDLPSFIPFGESNE